VDAARPQGPQDPAAAGRELPPISLPVGNARPLDQATQHATTEMIRCLNELGLEGSEGTCSWGSA